METHVNVFAPSRTKRVLSQRYGPLIILKNPDAYSAELWANKITMRP